MSDIEKKELNEEQLDQVAGGSGGNSSITVDGHTFTGHVGKYSTQVGERYWIVADDFEGYARATLVRSYERDNFFIGTTRYHAFHCMDVQCDPTFRFVRELLERFNDQECTNINGDDVTLYLYRDGEKA